MVHLQAVPARSIAVRSGGEAWSHNHDDDVDGSPPPLHEEWEPRTAGRLITCSEDPLSGANRISALSFVGLIRSAVPQFHQSLNFCGHHGAPVLGPEAR